MRYAKLSPDLDQRYDDTGGGEYGELLVGEDHIVRWFSRDELQAMHGLGDRDGASGYTVYEDGHGPGRARVA